MGRPQSLRLMKTRADLDDIDICRPRLVDVSVLWGCLGKTWSETDAAEVTVSPIAHMTPPLVALAYDQIVRLQLG